MKSLGKIVCSLNNIYCPQKIMKSDWPAAAGFNLSIFFYNISSKIIFQLRKIHIPTNLQQIPCQRKTFKNLLIFTK